MSSVYKEVPHMNERLKWKLIWYGLILTMLIILKIAS